MLRPLAPALLAAAALVAVAPLASAAPLTSFESATPGAAAGSPGTTGVIVDAGPGITDGTQAARGTLVSGNSYQKLVEIDLNGLSPGTQAFTIDWNYQYDGASSGYLGLTAALFSAATATPTATTGFNQLVGAKTVGDPNEFINTDSAQYTVVYNLDATEMALLDNALAQNAFIQLQLYGNKAGTRLGSLTVDNVRFTPAAAVPEPTAGLLMLGGAGLAALRRRRA